MIFLMVCLKSYLKEKFLDENYITGLTKTHELCIFLYVNDIDSIQLGVRFSFDSHIIPLLASN